MPTKDELSEQLAVTQKLTVAVNQMANSLARVDNSYQSQIDAVEKLTAAIEKLKGEDLSGLNQTKMGHLQKEFKDTEHQTTSLSGRLKGLGQQMKKQFPGAIAIAGGAVSGFMQGLRNLTALTKGVGGFFTSLIDWAGSLVTALIAIPFKIFENLVDAASKVSTGMMELMQAIQDVKKEFGDLKGPVSHTVMDTMHQLKNFSQTGLSTWRVFGNLAERLQHITKVASSMGATMGVMRREFQQNGGALLAYQKGLGVTDEEMKGIAQRAIDMGKPMGKVFLDMTKQTMALGKAFNVDQKLIGKDMSRALQDVDHFGAMTVQQIAQASVYARKLGVELDKITGTLDAFDTFDTAAENVAKLSQSFGVSVDAFKMMQAQNPADQIDMLRKSFQAAGIDSANFTRQQAKLLAQTTGLDQATVRQVFASKNYGVSLDKIKKKSQDAQHHTMTQAQAMSKLADSIELMVKQGPQLENSFFKMFMKGFSSGIQWSKDFRMTIIDIRMALLKTYYAGRQLGLVFTKVFPGVHDILKGIQDVVKPIPGFFKKIGDAAKLLFKGKTTIAEFINSIRKEFSVFTDTEKGPFGTVVQGFYKFGHKLSELAGQVLKWLVKSVTDVLKKGTEFLKDPKKYLATAENAGNTGLKFMMDILQPLIDAAKDVKMWERLFDAFKGFAGELWGRLKQVFVWMIGKIPTSFWIGVAAVFFGPIVTRTLLGAGIKVVGGAVFKMFKTVAMRSAGMAEKAIQGAGAGEGILGKFIGPLLGNPYVAVAAGVAALTTVGIGMSKGIDKFKKGIAKSIGTRDDRTVGAATAGIVQMLSFGKINDVAAQKMATNIAKFSNKFYKAVQKSMGKGFAKDLRALIMTRIDALIDVGDFVRNIFHGNISGAIKSLGKLLWDVAVGALAQMKMFFFTIPMKLIEWLTPMFDKLSDWLDGLFQEGRTPSITQSIMVGLKTVSQKVLPMIGGIMSKLFTVLIGKLVPAIFRLVGSLQGLLYRIPALLIGWIGDAFEKHLGKFGKFLNQWLFQPLKHVLMSMGQFIPFAAKYLGNAITNLVAAIKAKVQGKKAPTIFPDPRKAFAEYQAHLHEATDKVKKANEKATVQVAKTSKQKAEKMDQGSFISTAMMTTENIGTLKKNLAKLSDKDLEKMKKSFSRVLNVFGDNKIVGANSEKLQHVSSVFDSMATISQSVVAFEHNLRLMAHGISKLTSKEVTNALRAVGEMVHKTQELDDALSKAPTMNVDAKLKRIAKASGIGGKFAYTVKSKEVVINLHLNVSMNVDDVEKVMIMRKNSTIRDRLDFLTDNAQAGPPIMPKGTVYTPTPGAPHAVNKVGGGTH